MMMPRKKRKLIIITSIILVIFIIVAIFVALYINTDFLKSNTTLFTKYIGQSFSNIDEIYNEVSKNEYNDLLEEKKFTNTTRSKSKLYKKIRRYTKSYQSVKYKN